MAQLIERGDPRDQAGLFVLVKVSDDGTIARETKVTRTAAELSHYGSTLVTVTADVQSEQEMQKRLYQTALGKAAEIGATWVLATPYEQNIVPCDGKHAERACPGSFVRATLDFYV